MHYPLLASHLSLRKGTVGEGKGWVGRKMGWKEEEGVPWQEVYCGLGYRASQRQEADRLFINYAWSFQYPRKSQSQFPSATAFNQHTKAIDPGHHLQVAQSPPTLTPAWGNDKITQ